MNLPILNAIETGNMTYDTTSIREKEKYLKSDEKIFSECVQNIRQIISDSDEQMGKCVPKFFDIHSNENFSRFEIRTHLKRLYAIRRC